MMDCVTSASMTAAEGGRRDASTGEEELGKELMLLIVDMDERGN